MPRDLSEWLIEAEEVVLVPHADQGYFPQDETVCWRCDSRPAATDVGLCADCKAALAADRTEPPELATPNRVDLAEQVEREPATFVDYPVTRITAEWLVRHAEPEVPLRRFEPGVVYAAPLGTDPDEVARWHPIGTRPAERLRNVLGSNEEGCAVEIGSHQWVRDARAYQSSCSWCGLTLTDRYLVGASREALAFALRAHPCPPRATAPVPVGTHLWHRNPRGLWCERCDRVVTEEELRFHLPAASWLEDLAARFPCIPPPPPVEPVVVRFDPPPALRAGDTFTWTGILSDLSAARQAFRVVGETLHRSAAAAFLAAGALRGLSIHGPPLCRSCTAQLRLNRRGAVVRCRACTPRP